jgi:hypothetical protein
MAAALAVGSPRRRAIDATHAVGSGSSGGRLCCCVVVVVMVL